MDLQFTRTETVKLADGKHIVHAWKDTAEAETTVRDVMVRHPKILPAHASLMQARAALAEDHVHMVVLLTEGRRLVGTVTRTDLPSRGTRGPALPWSRLVGRSVSPDAPTTAVRGLMIDREVRRLAVVAVDGSLLGLMCLKQRGTGFCADADIDARSRSREK